MLQRAASSAHSWWWASHVRTKQSKWLEQSLQDMEEKVGSMLKLIEEDGDSFAKRAEMYYKKRPELINFVEESFRAYRSLTERYDHISKELQNANTTIASVFPEQIQFAMEDEEDFASPRVQKTKASQTLAVNVPKVPKYPSRDLKGLLTSASKKLQAKKALSQASNTIKAAPKSGLSKSEAVEEIDKVQKEILALQTVKEFVRSSYESRLTKYWEIDSQITKLQERVCELQDEFMVGKVIEDDEARTLMAEAALKSCDEALAQLQEKQEKLTKAAITEFKRVNDTHERLKLLKHKFLPGEKANGKDESVKTSGNQECLNLETGGVLTRERLDMEEFIQEIKEHFEVGFKESLSVTELAEKIDELVSKVISLETTVSSQTALIDRLKMETDDLQLQINTSEDDEVILTDGTSTMTDSLWKMEEKLNGIQDLNDKFENQNNDLQICFTEASCSLDQLSEKLHIVKTDEDMESLKEKEESSVEGKTRKELGQENIPSPKYESTNSGGLKQVGEDRSEKVITISVTNPEGKEEPKTTISQKGEVPETVDKVTKEGMPRTEEEEDDDDDDEVGKEKDGEPNWQQMLLNGLEDKEKILLQEYTLILRNYKGVKKKLSDVENKNRDSLFETTVQLRDLRSAIGKRDEEIQSLRQKLKLLQEKVGESRDLEEVNPSIILFDDQNAESEVTEDSNGIGGVEEDVKLILIDQIQSVSPIEEKLRVNIDALLDENLNFWLRFSTSFHQIQKFNTRYQDLDAEILKLKEKGKSNKEGSTRARVDIKSNLRPIYAHLSEIQTELSLWIEQSALLKVELQRRFSSLCKIQEEISEALKAGAEEEEMRFTSYEAAKFQGEVLNMKQENKKVREEIQMGLDHVLSLQHEIEKTLEKLDEEFGISGSKNNNPFRRSTSRSRVPLRSFIFGTKPKKRASIFSCMHDRKYNDLRSRLPM